MKTLSKAHKMQEPQKFTALVFRVGSFKWVTEDPVFPVAYEARKPNRTYVGSLEVALEIKACVGGYAVDLCKRDGTLLVQGRLLGSYAEVIRELHQRKEHYQAVGVDLPPDKQVATPLPKAEKSFWVKLASLFSRGQGQSCK
jgi:hypothetical protein